MVQNLSQVPDDTPLENRTFGIRFLRREELKIESCMVCWRFLAHFHSVWSKETAIKYWNDAKNIFKNTTNGESLVVVNAASDNNRDFLSYAASKGLLDVIPPKSDRLAMLSVNDTRLAMKIRAIEWI